MYKHTTINFIFFVLIIILLAKKVFLLNMDTLYNTFQFSIILAKSYISSICKSPVCKEVDNYILCKGREFQFFMNPLDSLITTPVKLGYEWEGYLHQYFSKHKSDKGIAIEFGANIGLHTVYLSKYFKEIYAYEPQKEMFKQLKLNIEVNSIKNVKIFNANPSSDKEILFCKSDKKKIEKFDNLIGEIKVANQNNLNNTDCQKIIIKKIDSLKLKRKVSFIKVDYEFEKVLEGARKTIKKDKPVILFKEDDYTNSQIIKQLKELNYSIQRISLFNDWIAYSN